ncbi:hypothetical protein MTR_2g015875 [Medicago truncatula]|uniref:Uncharacterized protein n=1 Tax=Medicago truncatula TaxID=3880 RepID=A0A072V4I4_MEDTR|nr:hypothetical protein MTR_2g015875 [Medicago truncatula]
MGAQSHIFNDPTCDEKSVFSNSTSNACNILDLQWGVTHYSFVDIVLLTSSEKSFS